MEAREEFEKVMNERKGLFFRFYDRNRLRIGKQGKFFLEGVGEHEVLVVKSIPKSEDIKIFIVNVVPSYFEGKLGFDAMVSSVDGHANEKVVFFFPNEHDKRNLELIKKHEINHVRTFGLLGNLNGELNSFYSEILADVVLILEMEEGDRDLKLTDVRELKRSSHAPDYYKRYLSLIERILILENHKEVASLIFKKAKENQLNPTSVEQLDALISEIIEQR